MITRPEESYRMWCVVSYDLETSRIRRPWPIGGYRDDDDDDYDDYDETTKNDAKNCYS